MRRLDLKKNMRIRWEIEGDENNKIFHGITNGKKRKKKKINKINGLMTEGRWEADPGRIKEVWHFFPPNLMKQRWRGRNS